jgi:hypothetical protein
MRWISYLAAGVLFVGLGANVGHSATTPLSTHQQSDSQKLTFVGKVTRNSDNRDLQDQYILYDENRMQNFYLDDTQKAQNFDDILRVGPSIFSRSGAPI